MISKTTVFTTITPLPGNITREAVISTYHNHIEMIELNPLVVERFKCRPPSNATPEEFHAIWYTIKGNSYFPRRTTSQTLVESAAKGKPPQTRFHTCREV